MTCSVCHVDPVVALNRCATCYRYRVRTGRDRTFEQIQRWLSRRYERHLIGRLLEDVARAI